MKRLSLALGTVAMLLLAACGDSAGTTQPAEPAPTTGLYVAAQFPLANVTRYGNVVYGTRPNAGGQYTSEITRDAEITQPTLALRMDIAVPPNASASSRQPLIVFIHGGGFVGGDKSDYYDVAESYVRAGYVTASINYRLTRGNGNSEALRTQALLHAAEDALNAIRFLRTNAERYGIDPTRIASVGSSAGGGLSLSLGLQADDPRFVSDYPGVSSRVSAAVSTGATLYSESAVVDAMFTFERTDAPILLYHAKEADSNTGRTWTEHVLGTQQRINASGNSCTTVAQPNLTHTVALTLGGEYWPPMREFLWTQLRLSELR